MDGPWAIVSILVDVDYSIMDIVIVEKVVHVIYYMDYVFIDEKDEILGSVLDAVIHVIVDTLGDHDGFLKVVHGL